MSHTQQPGNVAASFEADGFLRAVMDTIVDAIITIDIHGTIHHANPATERLFGYPLKSIIGQNITMLMPAPYSEEHGRYVERYLTSREPRIIGIGRRVTARRKDGTIIPVDLAVSEVTVDGTIYFTGVVRDVSERVAAEEQIRKERDFSRSLIDTAHAIILVLDPRGRIERFNPYMEQLVGYSLDQVVGRDWFDIFILEDDRERLRDLFHKTLAGTPVVNNINPIVTRSGELRVITWSGRRLMNLDGDVVGLLAIGNDITELKETERKLVQSERLAAVGQMVTGLAHESRNALQRSQACLEMLELDLDQPGHVDLIHKAKRALAELQRLYEEVRSYAAPFKLGRKEFRISKLLQESWHMVEQVAQPKDVTFEADVDTRVDTMIGDPDRLLQVFRNIIENALAVSPQPATIWARVGRSSVDGRPAVTIAFRDEGPGLTAEQMARMMEPFFTTKVKGTGLGLAIAQRIVEAHGGTIAAENHAAGGAEIVICLPVER